jgi:predicted alpha/beta hydrolase
MGFKTYSGPLLAISIGDDAYAPPQVAAHLLSLYTAARKEQRTIAATADAIGHFGFFRRRDLWPDPVRWLLSRAGCA